MKFRPNESEMAEFQRTQNPKLHPPIPIRDLEARVQRIRLHWDLASRLKMELLCIHTGAEKCVWEEFCDFGPCLKTNFGTTVNALSNFSTKMGG
ncbi:hypothetical protein AVEN_105397-1 [Araneus ventricosus]|uniref:Uncharacterized protein n=1 Tax=Araneus ventricosus TaxID=182803 RepID=A0A4Y2TKZ2_ARAVE|nr:hypothetical protein AVEN_105397-1 [Araneus ventricosus]